MPAPVERKGWRSASSAPQWVNETRSGERLPNDARGVEEYVEARLATPEVRAGVESLAALLQKPNHVLSADELSEPLSAEEAWPTAEAVRRIQMLDLEVRRIHRLNNRGAVDSEVLHRAAQVRTWAEQTAAALLGRQITGEALWNRRSVDSREEREADLDRYGPRQHLMTAPARGKDA